MSLSLNISKGGIKAHQKAMSNIANNIANVNSEGYKAKSTHFVSLLNNEMVTENGNFTVNAGARSEVLTSNFSQGSFIHSPSTLQLSLEGEGYFQVQDGLGNTFLTRDGAFSRDETGQIVNASGDYLMFDASVPVANWPDGSLSVMSTGELFVGQQQVGTIPVYLPESSESLVPVGGNKYQYTGDNLPVHNGQILQNYAENSNVDLAQELTNMIVTQRAYSLNVKVAQSNDEMMSLINQFNQ